MPSQTQGTTARQKSVSPRRQPMDEFHVGWNCVPPAVRLLTSTSRADPTINTQWQQQALQRQEVTDELIQDVDVAQTTLFGSGSIRGDMAWLSRYYQSSHQQPRKAGATTEAAASTAASTTAGEQTPRESVSTTKAAGRVPQPPATVADHPSTGGCSPRQGVLRRSAFLGSWTPQRFPQVAGAGGVGSPTGSPRGEAPRSTRSVSTSVHSGGALSGAGKPAATDAYAESMNWRHFSSEMESSRRAHLPRVLAAQPIDDARDVNVMYESALSLRSPHPAAASGFQQNTGGVESPMNTGCDTFIRVSNHRDVEGLRRCAERQRHLDEVLQDWQYQYETYLRENVEEDLWPLRIEDQHELLMLFQQRPPASVGTETPIAGVAAMLHSRLQQDANLMTLTEAVGTPADAALLPLNVRRRRSSLHPATLGTSASELAVLVVPRTSTAATKRQWKTFHRVLSAALYEIWTAASEEKTSAHDETVTASECRE